MHVDPPRTQRRHPRRLRASAADQPVRQRPVRRLPDPQLEERQLAPPRRRAQVQGEGCRGCRVRSVAEESGAQEGVGRSVCYVVQEMEARVDVRVYLSVA